MGLFESKIGLIIFNSAAAERECGAGRALSIVNPLACLVAWAIARKVNCPLQFLDATSVSGFDILKLVISTGRYITCMLYPS